MSEQRIVHFVESLNIRRLAQVSGGTYERYVTADALYVLDGEEEPFTPIDEVAVLRQEFPIIRIGRHDRDDLFIAYSPEVEEFLGKPYTALHQANGLLTKDLRLATSELDKVKSMTWLERLKFLFTGRLKWMTPQWHRGVL